MMLLERFSPSHLDELRGELVYWRESPEFYRDSVGFTARISGQAVFIYGLYISEEYAVVWAHLTDQAPLYTAYKIARKWIEQVKLDMPVYATAGEIGRRFAEHVGLSVVEKAEGQYIMELS